MALSSLLLLLVLCAIGVPSLLVPNSNIVAADADTAAGHGCHHHHPLTRCSLARGSHTNYVVNIPSGAPPTNDGYAYSNLAYDNFTLYIAGQNGYDVCGNLLPLGPDGTSRARILRAFLNLKAILECFNEPITQVEHITVTLADPNATLKTPNEQDDWFLAFRSLVNDVQRNPLLWGPTNPVMARTIYAVLWLSRGDTFEVTAMPVARTHPSKRTCLDTGIPPPTAIYLQKLDTKAGRYPCPPA